jgi:transcriptional regulator with XRE-family HTH domain
MARARRISAVTARRVRVWRDRRDITAEELSARATDMGHPLSRVAITQIENGKRGISLDEALVLALALNVPPLLLLLPLDDVERVAITPKIAAHPDAVRRWLVGEEEYGWARFGSPEWLAAAETLRLWEALHEALEALQDSQRALMNAEFVNDDDTVRRARERYVKRIHAYADVRDEMVSSGVTPPKVDKTLATELTKLGRKEN